MTSGPVTKFIRDYFTARPQLKAPVETIVGFDIPQHCASMIHSLLNERDDLQKKVQLLTGDS